MNYGKFVLWVGVMISLLLPAAAFADGSTQSRQGNSSSSRAKTGETVSKTGIAAKPLTTHEVLEQITRARGNVRTIVAQFEQTRRIGLLATDVTSRGNLVLVRPHQLRWELLAPEEIMYWVGPQGLSYRSDESFGTVDKKTAGALGEIMADLLVFLAGDINGLHSRYALTAAVEQGFISIAAKPKHTEAKQVVKLVTLKLGQDWFTPIQVVIRESDTEYVKIRFFDVRKNAPVAATLMQPNSVHKKHKNKK